jgi:cobaltochelatase CobS
MADQINVKQIAKSDVTAAFDIMLAYFEKNDDLIPGEEAPAEFVTTSLRTKLVELNYQFAPNLDAILKGHASKIARGKESRETLETKRTVAVTLAKVSSGVDFEEMAATIQPAEAEAAPKVTALPKAEAPAEVRRAGGDGGSLTVTAGKELMIDPVLAAVTSNKITSISALIGAMEAAETAAEGAKIGIAAREEALASDDVAGADIGELPEFKPSGFAQVSVESPMLVVLEGLLAENVSPSISCAEIIQRLAAAEKAVDDSQKAIRVLDRKLRLNGKSKPQTFEVATEGTADADQPASFATVNVIPALGSDAFSSAYGTTAPILDFEVPTLDFGQEHPGVPKVDPTFRFFAPVLAEALHAISSNEIMWLYGESGCGKSEFWKQVAARLNMPFTRLNLDGELTRADVLGVNRLLPDENGNTMMRFVEGILPRAMKSPGILLLDEFDLGSPEFMPILQPVLEGEPLVLLEDGGRVVRPHPLFRIAITGNTIGLGSENMMYLNAHEQSAATRDRIAAFVQMPYLPADKEFGVVMARVPDADGGFVKKVIQLANKVREGYRMNELSAVFSTRSVMYCATRFARYKGAFNDDKAAGEAVLETVVLGRMDGATRNAVKGFIDNIFA